MSHCRAYLMSENGREFCERKAGHRGWHWYTYQWIRNEAGKYYPKEARQLWKTRPRASTDRRGDGKA